MMSSLLITFREGLETTLIVGTLLAYLSRAGNHRGLKRVWLGTSLAEATTYSVFRVTVLAFHFRRPTIERGDARIKETPISA